MTATYIFGTSELAKLVFAFLRETKKVGGGYIVDKNYINRHNLVDGVIAWEDFCQTVKPDDCEIIVAIGYSQMNATRAQVFKRLKKYGYKIASFIHPTAIISPNAIIGRGNIIMENCVIQPFVRLGDGNIMWSNSTICHDSTIGNYNFFAASSTVLGCTYIGDCCFFGANSTIKHEKKIGSEVLVGAGCFCDCDLLDREVVVPAKGKKLDRESLSFTI